jgi:cation diffusion facilitator family transporter
MSDLAKRKETAALVSIFASAALTIGKLVAGILSGSLALISEAGHSLLDTGATILTYWAVKIAGRPADEEHHYGHGKVEAVAALCETGLLIALAVAVVVEAVSRLTGHEAAAVEATWLTYSVLVVAIAVDFVRWRSLKTIAKETRSDALAADALHFSSDMVGSILVLIGLVAMAFGFRHGDTLAAIGVAGFIAIAGFRLGKQTIETLIDMAPAGYADRVRSAALGVPGVVGVDTVRVRNVGSHVFGEIAIAVPRTIPIEKAIPIKDAVSAAIREAAPEATITVTANPRALDNESVLERVLLIAARRKLAVHHLTIQEINGVKSVSLDLEIDGRLSHGHAHEIASQLEAAIREEIGSDIEVETHIEPMEPNELSGTEAPADTTKAIAAALDRHAAGSPVNNVHNVRARQNAAGLVVNYHCRVDPALTVEAVHAAVDALDRKVRAEYPAITRIVGHADLNR